MSLVTHHDSYVPGLGMLSGAVVIYLDGLLAGNMVGNSLLEWWDRLISAYRW